MGKLSAKIAQNYLYNLSFQIFCIIVPLITTPYISRVLGAEKIGIYSYTLSISTYFIVVGNLGFPLYGQREIAYYENDRVEQSRRFFEIFYGQLFTMGIALVAYVLFLLFFVSENQTIFMAHAIGVLGGVINIGWLYQGMEEFRITVIRSFFIKITSVVLLFLLVKNPEDLIIYTLIINVANLVGNSLIFVGLKKYVDFGERKTSWKKIARHFKPALILGVPYYITSIYAVLDKSMLGMMSNQYSEVGYYEQSQKIVTFAMAIVTSLGTVFLPRLTSEIANKNQESVKKFLNTGLEVSIFLAMPIMTGMLCLGRKIVPWFFGDGYEKVGVLIIIFAGLILFMGLSNLIGNQYLLAAKKEKLLTLTTVVGTVINLIINALLIPQYGAYGAAIATVAAEFIKLAIQFVLARDVIYKKALLIHLLKYGLLSSVMGMVIMVLDNYIFSKDNFVNTIVLVMIAIFIYGIELIATKNHFVLIFEKKIRTHFFYRT